MRSRAESAPGSPVLFGRGPAALEERLVAGGPAPSGDRSVGVRRGGQETRRSGGYGWKPRNDAWRAGCRGEGEGPGEARGGGRGVGRGAAPGVRLGAGVAAGAGSFFFGGANSGRISDRLPVPPLIFRPIPSPRAALPEKPAR